MPIFDNLAVRWMRRYKIFFLLGFLIFAMQVFLAYKSLAIPDLSRSSTDTDEDDVIGLAAGLAAKQDSASEDDDANSNLQQKAATASISALTELTRNHLSPEQMGFEPECEINSKEAISAIQRAKTKDCRKHIAHIVCAIQAGHFYAKHLSSNCPTGNHTANAPLGCYRDVKEYRILSGYYVNLKTSNSPLRCVQLCLQSGYPYAGVQYGTECFCGAETPTKAAKLADSSCNMKCSGDAKEICGGYYSMNIYETGIAKFTAKTAETSAKPEVERVKIAFLLTLNGRALRQVHRLIKALYAPQHVFYIHVDARQEYLYRELLTLERKFRNVRLARKRFATIWGGASLLTMLLQCMEDLLASNWEWDFVINLSESDFPVKTVDKLVDFLTANRGRNFVKSHGRETQRFIQKQGLDKTFVECDTHMWRIGDRQLPSGIQVDGGSDWVALSRSFVEYVTPQSQNDELLQPLMVIFKHTLLPAESFFHTVLRNSRFCETYVDNNLHVTNWKRKLGCKCQYKHVVDWCGCSPNDFKPDDWSRLQGTEHKMLFFARKFEPIINQAIVLQLEEWLFGPYTSEYVNLHSYWQSLYDVEDTPSTADDATRTIGESVMRIVCRKLRIQPVQLLELTNFMQQDVYKGFVVHFLAKLPVTNRTATMEARIRPGQYTKVAKNSKIAKRLRNFEVSSDFDQKEQVSRNYAKLLGPYTELVLSFTFTSVGTTTTYNDAAHSYNLTLLWIDPTGRLQDFNELHIEDTQTDAVYFSKALLKPPLMPGIWAVKMISRSAAVYAQVKFLVSPLTFEMGKPLRPLRAAFVNGGAGPALPVDFVLPSEWQQHLSTVAETQLLEQLAKENAQRTDDTLLRWVDEVVGKFFHIRDVCTATDAAASQFTPADGNMPLCKETAWSSLAPDPKSDVTALLKRR